MIEDVLRETVPELQPAKQLHDFGVHRTGPDLVDGLFARFEDGFIHLRLDLGDDLLDARRVDAAVEDQAFHRFARYLAPDRIEAGKHDGVRRVVDQDRDAGGLLEGADVPAFPADDPALHVVARQGDSGRGNVRGVRAGVALDGQSHDVPGLVFTPDLGVVEDVADETGGVAVRLVLDLLEQLLARFGRVESGDLRERLPPF